MSKRKILWIAFAIMLASTTILAACAPAPAPAPTPRPEKTIATDPLEYDPGPSPHQWTVGVDMLTLAHPLATAFHDNLVEEAVAHGIELIFQDGEWTAEGQARILETFTTQGVDGIILWSGSATGLNPQVQAAEEAGIPVITMNMHVAYPNVAAIGVPTQQWARLEVDLMAQFLNGAGNVAYITGPLEAGFVQIQLLTQEKYREANYPNIKVVASQPAAWDRKKGKEVAEALIRAHPELDAIYGMNDEMLMGAAFAVQEAGLRDQIKLIGGDGTLVGIEALEDGVIDANVYQDPWKISSACLQVMRFILDAGITPDMVREKVLIPIPVFAVTQANVGDIPESKRW